MPLWFSVFLLLILPAFAERNILESFEERPFPAEDKKSESYRFTYLPTFDKPCVFRLDVISEDFGTLTIKRLSGKGGYELGKVELNKTVKVSGKEYKGLLRKLRNPNVWKPFGDHPVRAKYLAAATDGESWTLEGLRLKSINEISVRDPADLPFLVDYLDEEETTTFEGAFDDMSPFFQASYSLMLIASTHFTWEEKGIHNKPFELRKTAAFFQSPSFRQGLEILERVEREKPSPGDDPFRDPERIIPTPEERGRAHALLKKAIKECPGNPEPFLALANSYLEIQIHTEAEKALSEARNLAPEDPKILLAHGWVLAEIKNLNGAEKALSRARKLAPQKPNILVAYGWVLTDLRRLAEASEVYESLKPLDSALAKDLKEHIEAKKAKSARDSK